ncbi:folate-binding protein [Actimicrobium sp. CCI2.3]|uniref:CAF17-like 4Fe-4S cluster assembly/insertion protein YgfZ n=1 Tax=Actimicrobium sp. CCI2.3 TaxID=3048616 RepID=UPI002AB55BC0|nr:folate-binding protein [Actimicrobium sp. CCI2.3]MDY7572897.1 folate-binding protein [Actimicrobium sp. CCI2.3]MEB0020742.1 folate-binding protein [Actimicrobium sp. CCI2.3]
MTTWHQFIEQENPLSDAPAARPDTASDSFFSALTDLGLIAFEGDDAANFLHNQLTNDVEHLGTDEARLAGYCTPKGRLLASFLMWRSASAIILELARDIQPAIQKRLQMFVLRAKAKSTDVTEAHAVIGLGGNAVGPALASWFPLLPAAPYAKVETAAGTLIRLAEAGAMARYQWITTPETAIAAWPQLKTTLHQAGIEHWRLTEILAAVPHITLATQERFVPQMVNLEALGGVNFRKGCYPGQEIVARSQYLGKLKRRMLPASVNAPEVAAGMEVFAAGDLEQPCGMIVNAARDQAGLFHCLVEIKTATLDTDTVHLGAQGPALHFTALPYALPDTV